MAYLATLTPQTTPMYVNMPYTECLGYNHPGSASEAVYFKYAYSARAFWILWAVAKLANNAHKVNHMQSVQNLPNRNTDIANNTQNMQTSQAKTKQTNTNKHATASCNATRITTKKHSTTSMQILNTQKNKQRNTPQVPRQIDFETSLQAFGTSPSKLPMARCGPCCLALLFGFWILLFWISAFTASDA